MGTLTAFLATNLFLTPSYAADPSVVSVDAKSFPKELSKIEVPKEIGKIQESYQGKEKETVVLIQDAHAIPDAQRSIQKLIDYFQKEYGVSLVALEGAASELDPQIFRSFPDKELLRKVFEEYQAQGELAGGTAASIFSAQGGSASGGNETIFHGIEDWKFYEEGLGLYLQAMKKEPELLEKLGALEKELQEKKAELLKELFREQALPDIVSFKKIGRAHV